MAKLKNTSVGVMNFAGTIVAPGQTFEADEIHPGIKRMLGRKVLEKVSGSSQATSSSQPNDAEAARKAELIKQIEELTGSKPSGNTGLEKLEQKLKEAQEEDAKKKAAENGVNGTQQ